MGVRTVSGWGGSEIIITCGRSKQSGDRFVWGNCLLEAGGNG